MAGSNLQLSKQWTPSAKPPLGIKSSSWPLDMSLDSKDSWPRDDSWTRDRSWDWKTVEFKDERDNRSRDARAKSSRYDPRDTSTDRSWEERSWLNL